MFRPVPRSQGDGRGKPASELQSAQERPISATERHWPLVAGVEGLDDWRTRFREVYDLRIQASVEGGGRRALLLRCRCQMERVGQAATYH